MNRPEPHPLDDDADAITRAARGRALGRSPRLRRFSAVLWSAFLGAVCATLALLLAPESWIPLSLDRARITGVFFVEWALMSIPAALVCVLNAPVRAACGRSDDDG